MALRFRNVPDQSGAVGAAELHGAAGTRLRRSSHRRYHFGAEYRLYGSRLLRRANVGMEPRAHHRVGHPLELGWHAGAPRGPRRKTVLPARGAAVTASAIVERA